MSIYLGPAMDIHQKQLALSVERTLLSIHRTWLAYFKSFLACFIGGLALIHYFESLHPYMVHLGCIFVVISFGIILRGYWVIKAAQKRCNELS